MGEGDFMPMGGHRRKYDPKHAKKIKAGAKRADEIAKQKDLHHHVVEVPMAENELEKDLAEISS